VQRDSGPFTSIRAISRVIASRQTPIGVDSTERSTKLSDRDGLRGMDKIPPVLYSF
jgi:hypothetical protein